MKTIEDVAGISMKETCENQIRKMQHQHRSIGNKLNH